MWPGVIPTGVLEGCQSVLEGNIDSLSLSPAEGVAFPAFSRRLVYDIDGEHCKELSNGEGLVALGYMCLLCSLVACGVALFGDIDHEWWGITPRDRHSSIARKMAEPTHSTHKSRSSVFHEFGSNGRVVAALRSNVNRIEARILMAPEVNPFHLILFIRHRPSGLTIVVHSR